MSAHGGDIRRLAEEFESCQKILIALGDENRQHLMLEMMQMERCEGIRVGTITERSHLSRPAVSHHIQILKDAGILKMRREGTKNYYYFDVDMGAINRLIDMLKHAKEIMEQLPDRKGMTEKERALERFSASDAVNQGKSRYVSGVNCKDGFDPAADPQQSHAYLGTKMFIINYF